MILDEGQFNSMIDEHLPMFRRVSWQIVQCGADADDAVQQALVKAWSRLHTFRDQAKLSSWVTSIVIRESYDLLRRRHRDGKKHERIRENPVMQGGHNEAILAKLDRAIAGLPELYRVTIHVAVLSGIPAAEAAEILECTPNTLYQRVHKAKELLRESMEKIENE